MNYIADDMIIPFLLNKDLIRRNLIWFDNSIWIIKSLITYVVLTYLQTEWVNDESA